MGLKDKLAAAKPGTNLFNCLSQDEKAIGDIMADISYHIMDARRSRGLSQKEFAEILGVSQGMVSRWESCDYNFTLEKAVSIFSKLGLKIEITVSSNETRFKPPLVPNPPLLRFESLKDYSDKYSDELAMAV